ncbi:helitron_like_N domain-containing protein [Trichonephila clavipes]|nr:helitron_like_N domain-containing protein [Trichonephila clavipes]
MDKECQHYHAFKYKGEYAGLCCAPGKVSLPPLNPPPKPLKTLLAGATSQSKLFLRKIRQFNSCFEMTSLGATKIVHNEDGRNFETTFKNQGQAYHQIGSDGRPGRIIQQTSKFRSQFFGIRFFFPH